MSHLLQHPRILVLGTSYGGLSTTVNILNLLKGNNSFLHRFPYPEIRFIPKTLKPEITILDERDEFC
jgi:hypothetical protein